MSKSLGNALPLSASPDEIRQAVKMMYTDPNHLRVSDPGEVEGNVVFTYLDAFEPDTALVDDLKARYRQGGLGDTVIKKQLEERLQGLLEPIRTRREALARDPLAVMEILKDGTRQAREVAAKTLAEVKSAMGLTYF
jgi:tryptophanyl-tRNA synthetase